MSRYVSGLGLRSSPETEKLSGSGIWFRSRGSSQRLHSRARLAAAGHQGRKNGIEFCGILQVIIN